MRIVDCHGLAGGMALGMVQAGGTLLHRAGLPFGSPAAEANRHLLGQDWTTSYSADHNAAPTWDVYDDVDVVFGNPPCSGFSALSSRTYRGMDSPANQCMWSFVEYTARTRPTTALFESVTQAYSQGRPLMQALRAKLEELTGLKYTLYHIKHNGLGVGGAAIRARYFWLVSTKPFGVELEEPQRVPSVLESIGDLRGLDLQWEEQDYVSGSTWWSDTRRNPTGVVDGHVGRQSVHAQRMNDVLNEIFWEPGKDEEWAIRETFNKLGELPDSFENIKQRIYDRDFNLGFNGTYRWRPTRPAYVVTGDAANKIVHPTEPRLLTYREIFRIQGFPDTWSLEPLRNDSKIGSYPGKGIPVDCGRWVGKWVYDSINDEPGSYQGEEIGEREYLIDTGNEHKAALKRLLDDTEPAEAPPIA